MFIPSQAFRLPWRDQAVVSPPPWKLMTTNILRTVTSETFTSVIARSEAVARRSRSKPGAGAAADSSLRSEQAPQSVSGRRLLHFVRNDRCSKFACMAVRSIALAKPAKVEGGEASGAGDHGGCPESITTLSHQRPTFSSFLGQAEDEECAPPGRIRESGKDPGEISRRHSAPS